MKLIKIGLKLPPFCEDLEFPSLCEGLYSKSTYTAPISSTSQDKRMIFFFFFFFERRVVLKSS